MHVKIKPQGVQTMGKGDHRRNANPPTHQKGFGRILNQIKMIDGLGNEDLASFDKNAMHHF